MEFIKRSQNKNDTEDHKVRDTVETMLARIRLHGEQAVKEYAQTLDDW